MPIYTDPTDNEIAQLTDAGRELETRRGVDGLAFYFYGWAVGRGGYDPSNVVKVIPINPALTALIDQVYPTVGSYNLFTDANFEYPNSRGIALTCRIPRGAYSEWGLGELGIWVKIIDSPILLEIDTYVLYAVSHFPLKSKTYNSANVRRFIIQM